VQTKPIRRGKRKRKRKLRLGSRRVRVAPGRGKVVKFRLPARHRRLLRRLRKIRVHVTVAPYAQVSASRTSKRKSGLTLRTHRIKV
jgi:hypothetical protein